MKIWNVLPALVCILSLASCSKWDKGSSDETDRVLYPLIFEKDSLEIRNGIATTLKPLSCNGINTLNVSSGDTSLLTAYSVIQENGTSHASGIIRLVGRRKGRTSLTVHDRVSGETAVLDVRVVDLYLGMELWNSDHPLFPEEVGFLFLVDNAEKDFYLLSTKDQQPDKITQQGAYLFSMENNTPYLTLAVSGASSCKFDLSQNNQQFFQLLNLYFRLGWKVAPAAVGTKDLNRTPNLHMREETTGRTAVFVISDPVMPTGILN